MFPTLMNTRKAFHTPGTPPSSLLSHNCWKSFTVAGPFPEYEWSFIAPDRRSNPLRPLMLHQLYMYLTLHSPSVLLLSHLQLA